MKIKDILSLLKTINEADTAFLMSELVYQPSRIKAYKLGWRSREQVKKINQRKEIINFYNILGYLRRQGFVERKGKLVSITEKGLQKLKQKINKIFPIQVKENINDHLKIIVFDIPEKFKIYRVWLRQSLINLEFKMLQKSVWMGKAKLPEEFIFKLREYQLMKYIHIFSVLKTGTLNSN